MQDALLMAAGGTGITFLMTAIGAALVFFAAKKVNVIANRIFLGFAAGVMIAASVWSLLIPAMEEEQQRGGIGWRTGARRFVFNGAGFDHSPFASRFQPTGGGAHLHETRHAFDVGNDAA